MKQMIITINETKMSIDFGELNLSEILLAAKYLENKVNYELTKRGV